MASGFVDHGDRPVDDRQGAKAQKVKFYEARFFDIIFVVLGNKTAARLITIKR